MRRGKYKILLVSQDRELINTCDSIIKRESGFKLKVVKKGEDGISSVNSQIYDIVLFDQDIGDVSEREFCRSVKGPSLKKDTLYLIVIGRDRDFKNKMDCINEGANDFIFKPINPDEMLARLKVGQRMIRMIKKVEFETREMFSNIDVLLIQDGGCAPGYNPVTAFITYHLENQGRELFATKEGFKSLVSGRDDDFVRLVYDPHLFKSLDHIPGVFHAAPLSEWRGALLRSERYRDFIKRDVQEKAAHTIKKRNVKAIIAIGGNGTFKGINALCELIPTSIQVFFIPVTIDSDIAGTECIGQHTGVEMGAEKIRCYMADARTHKRTYIVEMMGANSGFHALHSCLGARAHLAVLPNTIIDHKKVVEAINNREECVIVVAEGYKKEERMAKGIKDNAAEYFYKELLATGIPIKRRVVCEPFSRDIRGAAPNNMDISLAQRMAYNVSAYLKAGTSRLMPAVESGREYAIPFHEIRTDNEKQQELMILSDRLTKR